MAREVQQHAGDAQRRLAEMAEQQAASLQRGALELQQQLADAVRQELRRDGVGAGASLGAAVGAGAGFPPHPVAVAGMPLPPPPLPPPSSQGAAAAPTQQPAVAMTDAQHMIDGMRSLERRFEQQWGQAMRAQSAERTAHMEALRAFQQAPTSVQAVVPVFPTAPPAPIPAPHPVVTTADVAAQVSIDAGTPPPELADAGAQASLGPSQEHEARVARFTEYLLHGPSGQREPSGRGLAPPLTAWPLPADLGEIDAMLAEALGGGAPPLPPPPESPPDSRSTMGFSSSGLADLSIEDLSLGEIPFGARFAKVHADAWRETRTRTRASPGELSPCPPSLGELPSEAASLGELPYDLSEAVSEIGDAFGRSAGEISCLSEQLSVGEIASSDLVDGVQPLPIALLPARTEGDSRRHGRGGGGRDWAAEHLEPGEVLASISRRQVPPANTIGIALSDGEAVEEDDILAPPSESSGEVPQLSGELVNSPGAAAHSAGSVSSHECTSSAGLPEPYLSPPARWYAND